MISGVFKSRTEQFTLISVLIIGLIGGYLIGAGIINISSRHNTQSPLVAKQPSGLIETTDFQKISNETGGLFDAASNQEFIKVASVVFPKIKIINMTVTPTLATDPLVSGLIDSQVVIVRYSLGQSIKEGDVAKLKFALSNTTRAVAGGVDVHYYDHVDQNNDDAGLVLTFHQAGGSNVSYILPISNNGFNLTLIAK